MERRAFSDWGARADTTPAIGLQRGLFALLFIIVAIGAAFSLALMELNDQVRRWGAIEVMDERREALLLEMQRLPIGTSELNYDTMAAALANLSEANQDYLKISPESAFGQETLALLQESTDLFDRINMQHETAAGQVAEIKVSLSEVFSFTTLWARSISDLTREIHASVEIGEDLRRETNLKQTTLTATHHKADDLQLELERLLGQEANGQNSDSTIQAIQTLLDQMPRPCAPEETANAQRDRFCKPSTARIIYTIYRVIQGPADERAASAREAIWALAAFNRTTGQRFFELSEEMEQALANATESRRSLEVYDQATGGLTRLNRVLNSIGAKTHDLETGGFSDLKVLDAQMRGLFSQIRNRTRGISTAVPEVTASYSEVLALVDELEEIWAKAFSALSIKQVAKSRLRSMLSDVSSQVSDKADQTRLSTGVWIDVFSKTTLVSLLSATVLIALSTWASHTYLTRPLAVATRVILALARSDDVGPVNLNQRALGFHTLGWALEKLRQANIQRRELVVHNQEQRKQIEANLRELEVANIEMERRATHDALTGLPNRRLSDEFLDGLNHLDEAMVLHSKDREFCLMHLDVDRFKEINDTLGHEAGDAILCHVARVLETLTGDGDVTFRIGGDEFLIARTRFVTVEAASDLAGKIVQEMNKKVEYEGHACRIGASIGIAFGSDASMDARQTLINADLALYQAKNTGRNCFEFFSETLQTKTTRQKELSDRILMAIENDEFVPYYQPQFHSADLSLSGLETLCRWEHPEMGILAPGSFLGCAEELRVLGKIDQLLSLRAAEDLRWLQSQGLQIPKISFNVTADRLMHSDLAETLVREIGGGTKIAVELLESMSLDSLSESVRWALDSLKEQGIGIEIDDFGSCRASIAGLIAVGPDAMKIDGSIVGPMTDSEQHLQLVKAIIEIGNALGIEVVAERVETEQHVEMLQELDCGILQGYALAKPMSAADLAAFLKGRALRTA